MLKHLRERNPELKINSIFDESFLQYGRIIEGYDFSELLEIMENRAVPESGNIYVASDKELMGTMAAKNLQAFFYGGMPIEVGYCNGNSSSLNALEYHKCSEIDISVSELILILGDVRQIKNNTLSSADTQIFYVPRNTPIELYSTTLHFAPCKVADSGFKSIIVLTDGTNLPLSEVQVPKNDEDKLLWMKNKWLIAHKNSIPASKGAVVGITGENITIKY